MGGHVVLTKKAVERVAEARAAYEDAVREAFGGEPSKVYVPLGGVDEVEAVAAAVGAEPRSEEGAFCHTYSVDAFGAQFFWLRVKEGL